MLLPGDGIFVKPFPWRIIKRGLSPEAELNTMPAVRRHAGEPVASNVSCLPSLPSVHNSDVERRRQTEKHFFPSGDHAACVVDAVKGESFRLYIYHKDMRITEISDTKARALPSGDHDGETSMP